ncbi:MAG: DUF3667 domain-containing protein [Prevotella sp.]|nr:DUF3667 domain-containing protein [Prevotella sp.]
MKKYLTYLTNKEKRTAWLRAFRMWQRRPYEVAPLKDERHVCSSCKTEFTGNYCPRCGQAAEVGRFSFKKALMLFLDVWAIGNRSMLRSLRDLMLRPGYMIRDYLSGMRSAYFPPFKMFFLLAAFSLVVEYGFDLGLSDDKKTTPTEQTTAVPADSLKESTAQAEQTTALPADSLKESTAQAEQTTAVPADSLKKDSVRQPSKAERLADRLLEAGEKFKEASKDSKKMDTPIVNAMMYTIKVMDKLWEKNPAVFALLMLMLFSLPLYLFLRHSPNVPGLRYSEFVVVLVYTANVYSIYSIIGDLLGSVVIQLFAVFMIFVTLQQFSGYSKKRLLGYVTLTQIIVATVLIALIALIIYLLYLSLE